MVNATRSWLIAAGLSVCLGSASAHAQIAVDVNLPAGLPAIWEGPAITDADAIAVCGGGQIHAWSDLLSGSPQHTMAVGIGSETMVGRWYQVGEKHAVYRALGPDGAPGTADDPLMLVSNLPRAPTITATGLTDIDVDFTMITRQTAARVDGAAFVIMRQVAGGIGLEWHTTVRPLVDTCTFKAGVVGSEGFAALDAGYDGLPGTPDDFVAVLSGIDGATATASFPVPSGAFIRGMRTLESGFVLTWWDVGLPTIRVAILDVASGAWSTIDVTPPAQPSPWFTPSFGVEPTGAKGFKVTCSDDLGPGEAHALVLGAGSTLSVVGTWYDDWNGAEAHKVISETEVVTWSGMSTAGYTYNDHLIGVSHFVAQPWSDHLIFEKPATPTLVAFSDQPAWMTGAGDQARTVVFADASMPGSEEAFLGTGRWAGGGFDSEGTYWEPRVEALAPGIVGGFLGDSFGNLHTLRVVTVPSASLVGSPSGGTSASVLVSAPGGAPGAQGTAISVRVDAPATWAPLCQLYVSTGILNQPVMLPSPLFSAGSLLRLNLAELAFVWPMPLSSGSGMVTFQVGVALGTFAGRPFYVQGVVEDSSAQLNVSAALQVVLN